MSHVINDLEPCPSCFPFKFDRFGGTAIPWLNRLCCYFLRWARKAHCRDKSKQARACLSLPGSTLSVVKKKGAAEPTQVGVLEMT